MRLLAKSPADRFDKAEITLAAFDAGDCIRSLERGRRFRKGLILGLLAVAVTVVIVCVFWGSFASPGIMRVFVDNELKTRILVEQSDTLKPTPFFTFPEKTQEVTSLQLVQSTGHKPQTILAGVDRPLGGNCLFAFDLDGGSHNNWNRQWGFGSTIHWPDCNPIRPFRCVDLAMGNIDTNPGDDIVIVAGDIHEYPTQISIFNPRTGDIGETFWHFGRIKGISLIDDYFPDGNGGGRPAIIAWGFNNKLDGFGQHESTNSKSLPNEDKPVVEYDIVPVLMILDPLNMNGLGPPRTSRVPLPIASVVACAYLDLPRQGSRYKVPTSAPTSACIHRITITQPCVEREICIELEITDNDYPNYEGIGTLFVDRNLYIAAPFIKIQQRLVRYRWTNVGTFLFTMDYTSPT